MSDVIHGEDESSIQRRSREETLAPEAAVTRFTIEIQHDTVCLLERIAEEIIDLINPLYEVLGEMFQSLNSMAIEDHATLLEISTGILAVNWIIYNALSPLVESLLSPRSATDPGSPTSSRIFLKVAEIFNVTLADLDSIANSDNRENILSTISEKTDGGNVDITSSISSIGDLFDVTTERITFISPAALMIFGPVTVMILTCMIADNKYYLFATVFAPMVDRVLSSIRSLFAFVRLNNQEPQHRTIPDEGETYDGVLWGMVALFCLESLLVGSIVVLMVLISLSLTIVASMPSVLSLRENPDVLEEMSKILIGILFSWVACVLTTNVLRMVLYQTVDNDD